MNNEPRPHYEKESNLEIEKSIAEFARVRWRCDSAKKLQTPAYPSDYAFLRGREVVAYAEIKDRPGLPFNYGDGYYLAVQKVVRVSGLAAYGRAPCLLLIQCKGMEIGWWGIEETVPGAAIWAGRTDRGDAADLEPHLIYPWGSFKRLNP